MKMRGDAYACTLVLVASFLLFLLELAVAKALLPRFGGSPMVWTTSMLAFQILLLAGYAYAYALSRRPATAQAATHAGLLVAAAVMAFWRLRVSAIGIGDPAAVSRAPVADLLLTLLATMAIPFAAVSATSPLVQHWHQRLHPDRSPYWLYAASNIGSFLGLLAYPFLIEPRLGLDRQFTLWAALFTLTAGGLVALSLHVRRSGSTGGGPNAIATPPDDASVPHRLDLALWLTLPACTSALLLAATNELCQDLAVFPFLWVLPLAAYLLSFSLTFRTRPIRNQFPLAAVVTLIALSTTQASLLLPAPVHVVSIGALIFVLCTAAHRELYRLRPPAPRLTAYYLWIAAGSGLGAAVVALLAPALFRGFWEFQGAVLALWAAMILAAATDPEGSMRRGDRRQTAVLLALALYMALNRIPDEWLRRHLAGWVDIGWSALLRAAAAAAVTAALWPAIKRRRAGLSVLWPRLLAGLMLFLAESSLVKRVRDDLSGSGFAARNFFGVVRIQEVLHPATGIQVRQLTHGRINHGWQYLNPDLRALPTAYHSPSTGIGRLIRALQSRRDSIRIGVTGLGVGALAAYPRAADEIVFYEIDPQVVELASGPRAAFEFLNVCSGRTEVVLGDARQALQAELARDGSRGYDVLALDAFSSDAIPMHLLTREAFSLYLAHLAAPHGVLAVNISNRFLNIEPVLADAAAAFDLHAVLVDTTGDPPVRARSIWVLMARNGDALDNEMIAEVARPLTSGRIAWTDTYGSAFQLLKWWTPRALFERSASRDHGKPQDATAPALAP